MPDASLGITPARHMSIKNYPLYEFITKVPSCYETTPVVEAICLFEQEQHDRLVVRNDQQIPLGLLSSANLLVQMVYEEDNLGNTQKFDWEQPISCLDSSLIQPIQIFNSNLSLEQFCAELRSQKLPVESLNWVLVDRDGKLLGLLDSCRLLRRLALSERQNKRMVIAAEHQTEYQEVGNGISVISKTMKLNAHLDNNEVISYADAKEKIHQRKLKEKSQLAYKYAAQLLEGLPWALMLETDSEVVSQNQLWYEQFGELKDPNGLKELLERTIEGKVAQIDDSDRNDLSHNPEASALNRCFIDSEPGNCVCIVEMQDGQERVWRFAKTPLDISDRDIHDLTNEEAWNQELIGLNSRLWLILATDITEQHQLTQELAAKNADLIQLNRLKDEFLTCISHELKTPLTAVLGLSRLLSDQQLGKLNDRQAKYAQLIHQSGRHLMSVVNDILDLTRMETGQMTLTPSKVNIRNLCDRALKEAKAIHAQNNKTSVSELDKYQFILDIELGLEQIVADELRLRQMLIHLLSNAFKFTEAGGEIGLQVNSWEGWIAFTIWDTGIGIPDSQQHLIFQKFQQLENPMTRQYEGTGLGLVLTRALARLHGGDVSFLSRENSGSQFTLLLPPSPPNKMVGEIDLSVTEEYFPKPSLQEDSVLRSSPSLKELPVENIPSLKNNSLNNFNNFKSSANQDSISKLQTVPNSLVLVVETVARYIDDFTKSLSALGYRVVIARSGCEALEKARRLQPKIIFINPLLTLLSGWDVLTLIKSDVATRNITTIVTASAAEKEQAFSKRADYFLSLPVQHQALTALLAKLCITPEEKPADSNSKATEIVTPLRILRLVEPEIESLSYHPSLGKHRVIEADDIEQAQLLARVWNFDVILLDVEMPFAQTYLKEISQTKILAALPLVTRSVETTQAASKIDQLSVFPCLTQLGKNQKIDKEKAHTLLSVLQIAAGVCCPPNILVVDLTMLPDLPSAAINCEAENDCFTVNLPCSAIPCSLKKHQNRPTEWFQALVQYLQTAGFKAAICNTWEEMLQQLRHESVDLLLICLGESIIELNVESILFALKQMASDLPPLLLLDRRLNSNPIELEKLETSDIATQILPRSISMENLLNRINQALSISN